MQNLFQKVSSPWVRYSEYECKEADSGTQGELTFWNRFCIQYLPICNLYL